MKVSNNFSISNLNNNFKQKQTITKPQIYQQIEQPKIDAQYYKANYSVAFKGKEVQYSNLYFPAYDKNGELKQLNVIIPDCKGKNLPLILKDDYLKQVLNEEGDIDAKKLNDFSTLFKNSFIKIQDNALKMANFYETFLKELEEAFNTTSSEYPEEAQIDTSGMTEEEIQEYCPEKSNEKFGRKKDEYADLAKEFRKRAEYDAVSTSALQLTSQNLKLMKAIGVEDISFVEENERLIDKIQDVEANKCGSRFDLYEELIKSSYKFNNNYDIQFMERIVDIMRESTMGFDKKAFYEAVNVVQDILSIDKENKENIYNDFIDFVKTFQEINTTTKDIFLNTINPITKKYDKKGLPILKKLAKETMDVIYKDELITINGFKECQKAEKEIIREYFEFIRDEETGEIVKRNPDIELFTSMRISKYLNT